jgi:exodeoxyribonuclease VII small subunit
MTSTGDHADPRRATADGPSYAAALAELDAILRELDSSDVDVDHLADRVARASELITLCREKISGAQLRIERVTAELDAAAPAPDTPTD